MVKLWLKTKDVDFVLNKETQEIVGTVPSATFISAAIHTMDAETKENCLEFLNKRKCVVSTCSSMLTAHSNPIRNDKFDEKLGKRVIMVKLNLRVANFRKQLIKAVMKNKCYDIIDNFETALKNEYRKF